MKVYNLEEARDFFLENSRGSCICVRDGKEQRCATYPEAVKFYEQE